MTKALNKRERLPESADMFDRLDQWFGNWTAAPWRRTWDTSWHDVERLLRVEEFQEDGTLVVRADLPGIDPDKDVELTVANGMLHIDAERHEEEKTEKRGYVRQELRYGEYHRSLPMPDGISPSDISAQYHDGILEVRVPTPATPEPKQIPIKH
ncbi:MAG TPA: Hsp20/alpha crystallin family protein [Acidimicrobiales bacterium]|jgi:HSP20 family protein|nr:Hsp20/alpha crystallin family protein [Acidimicrobiales bacterium]